MEKARFMDRQTSVRWQPVNDGMVDVTICLNEQKVTINQEGTEESMQMTMWEYDFHQFRESEENVAEEEIRKAPADYLNYKPYKEPSVEEKIEQMQLSNDMAIAELSILIGSFMTPQA